MSRLTLCLIYGDLMETHLNKILVNYTTAKDFKFIEIKSCNKHKLNTQIYFRVHFNLAMHLQFMHWEK